MNQCHVCKEPTDKPKFCSRACKQKDWRARHPYGNVTIKESNVTLSVNEAMDALNWYLSNDQNSLKQLGGDMGRLVMLLFNDDRQLFYNGQEYVIL